MRIIQSINEWRVTRRSFDSATEVGFVPTMGALHDGHVELLRRARRESDVVVLSIFVNPTQFNDPGDLEKYPRTLEVDLEIAQNEGVDFVFIPEAPSMYADQYRYQVTENRLSRELCGARRPGHFDGVLSVVLKLFNLVRPQKAFFGEKDFQQLELVRGMAQAFFLDIQVVPVSTVREKDGLAMSSRNTRLTPEQRKLAPAFPEILSTSADAQTAEKRLSSSGFDVDYVEDKDGRRFGAVKLGDVRLIDNLETRP